MGQPAEWAGFGIEVCIVFSDILLHDMYAYVYIYIYISNIYLYCCHITLLISLYCYLIYISSEYIVRHLYIIMSAHH